MSAGGLTWDDAGDLALTGATDPTAPNPANTPDDYWWHPSWWKFTPEESGMLVLDLAASTPIGTPSTYLAVFTGTSYETSTNIQYNDGVVNPDLDPSLYVPKMFLFVEAGVEYHLIAGVWDDPPTTVDSIVVTTAFYANGPGTPGATWDDAGEIGVGFGSRPIGEDQFGDGEFWFKFTPDADGWVVFDTESLSTRSYPDRGFGGSLITLYSGDTFDDKVFLEDWSSRYPDGFGSGIYVAIGAYQVTAGVEYHLVVSGIYDMWNTVLGVSEGVLGDFSQPDDETFQHDMLYSDAGSFTEGSYNNQPSFIVGDPSAGELQDDMNEVWNDRSSSTTTWSTSGSGSIASYIVLGAWKYSSGPTTFRAKSVSYQIMNYIGIIEGGYTAPYDWEVDAGITSPESAGIDYTNGGQAQHESTFLEVEPRYNSQYGDCAVDQTVYFRISPDTTPGSGRELTTVVISGSVPEQGTDDPDYATPGSTTIEIVADDYDNEDQIVYILVEYDKTETWTGAVTVIDSHNVNVDSSLTVDLNGPGSTDTPLFTETFVPPQWRSVFAGEVIFYPDVEEAIDGQLESTRVRFYGN